MTTNAPDWPSESADGQRPYRDRHGITRWLGPRPVDPPERAAFFDRGEGGTECVDCLRNTIHHRVWRRMTRLERNEVSATHAERGGYGRCIRCYTRLVRAQCRALIPASPEGGEQRG